MTKPKSRQAEAFEANRKFTRLHLGANRFRDLVEEKFYDDTRFFRVIPSFMVQFGLSGDPAKSAEWRSLTINDEPVKESNKPGYITFAKTGVAAFTVARDSSIAASTCFACSLSATYAASSFLSACVGTSPPCASS